MKYLLVLPMGTSMLPRLLRNHHTHPMVILPLHPIRTHLPGRLCMHLLHHRLTHLHTIRGPCIMHLIIPTHRHLCRLRLPIIRILPNIRHHNQTCRGLHHLRFHLIPLILNRLLSLLLQCTTSIHRMVIDS